ncbi:MAG TPA: hypothetical protein PLS63_10835, partial [Microthrixaceae bacterium]|nr:hypothetical protein [Microthrixaceae bacterium]
RGREPHQQHRHDAQPDTDDGEQAAVLLMGLEVGPNVGGDTRLVVLLGAGGLALGAVLLLRVIAAVVRDGTV